MKSTIKSTIKDRSPKSRLAVIVAVLFAVVGIVYLLSAKAATGVATFSISPASGSLEINKPTTFSLYENPGNTTDAVGAFELRLAYDTTKLTFVTIDSTGGGFTDCFEKSGAANNGKATLVCSKLGGSLTGNQKIGEVVFTPKVGSGTTTISIDAGSYIYKADGVPTDIWSGNLTGYTYTLTAPLANLKVSNVTLSNDRPQPGQSVTITATITNSGTAVVPAGANVATAFKIDTAAAVNVATPTPIAIGASVSVVYTWTATAGTHTVTVTSDATNAVAETSESDNAASKTFSVVKSGDANGDGAVNSTDLAIFSFNYGKSGATYAQGDFNGDGTVNSADVAILSFNWGK